MILKRTLKTFYKSLIILLISLFLLLLFLTTTRPGLYASLYITGQLLPGTLKVESLHGNLIKNLEIKKFTYQDDGINIEFDKLSLSWRLTTLLYRHLSIKALNIDKLVIATTTENNTSSQPATLPKLPFSITLDKLHINQFSYNKRYKLDTLDVGAIINKKSIALPKLNIKSKDYVLTAAGQGQLTQHKVMSFHAYLSKAGKRVGSIVFSGDSKKYLGSIDVHQPVDLNAKFTLVNLAHFELDSLWHGIEFPVSNQIIKSSNGNLKAYGSIDDYRFKLETTLESPTPAKLNLQGYGNQRSLTVVSDAKAFSGTIKGKLYTTFDGKTLLTHIDANQLNFYPYPFENLNIELSSDGWPLNKIQATAKGSYNHHSFNADINYADKQIKSTLTLGNNKINIDGSYPFPLRLTANINQLSQLTPSLPGLNASLYVDADIKEKNKGTFSLKLNPGSYKLDNILAETIAFNGGQINATLSQQGLIGQGHIDLDKFKKMHFNIKLPNLDLENLDINKQTIDFSSQLNLNSLSFLDKMTTLTHNTQGAIATTTKITGTLKKISINSSLTLSNARTELPLLNIQLKPVNLSWKSSNNQWQAQGTITSSGNQLTLAGKGVLAPSPFGTIRLSGQNFIIANTEEYKVTISPDFSLSLGKGKNHLTGTLSIPQAIIKPKDFSSSETLPEDVVFEHEKPTDSTPFFADIKLHLGDDVRLLFMGLVGKLSGDLAIKDEPQKTTTAVGQLRVLEGEYEAYGIKLKIDRGELLYSGGAIDNPGINVVATKTFKNAGTSNLTQGSLFDFNSNNLNNINWGDKLTVGIRVTNRLNKPKIKLFSQPATLSESNILSMLLLGRPVSQATQSEGTLLLSAISALNLNQGSSGLQLESQLKKSLGIDFDIRTEHKYDQTTNKVTDSKAFVLSKKLSSRLSMTYSRGLSQDSSDAVIIRYLLNKYFTLQVNAGLDDNGFDVFYTYHTKEGSKQ